MDNLQDFLHGRMFYEAESCSPAPLMLLAAFSDPDRLIQGWRSGHPRGGMVPLHAAAVMDKVACMEALIGELQQDINERDDLGWSALHHACRYGSTQAITFLASHGANLNAQALNGCTALHNASLAEHPKKIAMLVYMGADLELEDLEGSTPVQTMIRGGDIDQACHMARLGADCFKKDKNGKSAMRMAKDMDMGHRLDLAVQDWRISCASGTLTT